MSRPLIVNRTLESLRAKLDRCTRVADSGCWEWTGALYRNGYGSVPVGNHTKSLVHRVAYFLLVGPIPEGMQLDHLCRNRKCCNPDHLEPVSSRENTMRGVNPMVTRARHAAKTVCKYGHPLSGDNVYLHGNRRHCRACRTISDRRARPRRYAAASS